MQAFSVSKFVILIYQNMQFLDTNMVMLKLIRTPLLFGKLSLVTSLTEHKL